MLGGEDLETNTSEVKCSTKDPPTIPNELFASKDPFENDRARSPSKYQVETVSTKKASFNNFENNCNTSNVPDILATSTEQKLSIFDLLGDERPNSTLEANRAPESHVAFSVEGLGKVGTETPVHSPQQPSRVFHYGCSSKQKAASRPNSSTNFSYLLDDFELEVENDTIFGKNVVPVGGRSFEFSTGFPDSDASREQEVSTFRDHKRSNRKMKGSICDNNVFNDGHNNEHIWDGRHQGPLAGSGFRDENFFDEREDDVYWNNWPCQTEGDSVDFLDYEYDGVFDHRFGHYYQPRKRDHLEGAECIKFIDDFCLNQRSQVLRRQASENNYDSFNFSGSGHPNSGRNKYFGDVRGQADWSHFVDGDTMDSLSLLSEESCSSSAVRGEATSDSQLNIQARGSRRFSNNLHRPGNNYEDKNISIKETQYKTINDLEGGKNAQESVKCTIEPFPRNSKLHNIASSHHLNNLGPSKYWVSKEDIVPGLKYFCQTSEKKIPPLGSKLWNADPFDDGFPAPQWYTDANSSLARFKDDEIAECSHFGSFVPEKSEYCEPFSSKGSPRGSLKFSKVGLETHPDLFSNHELEGVHPCSSHAADSFREPLVIDSSLQQNTNREYGSKDHPAINSLCRQGRETCNKSDDLYLENNEAKSVCNSKGYDTKFKEDKNWTSGLEERIQPEHVGETSSSVQNSENSRSILEENESKHDAEIPLPGGRGSEGIEDDHPEEVTSASTEDGYSDNASQQMMMMIESYALQLLCVQKVSKKASTRDTLNKLKDNLEIKLQKQILLTSGISLPKGTRKEYKSNKIDIC